MLIQLKDEVLKANLELVKHNLVIFTWGNVSVYDEENSLVAIKPSGVPYGVMTSDMMVVVNLDGKILEGNYKPSSDLATHIEIYKNFSGVKSVVHTHSTWATIFAQSGKGIPPLGTTHSDYFNCEIPCTRLMSASEVESEYEKNTGKVIVETFKNNGINPLYCPGVLVNEHGPFTWGKTSKDAVHNAVVLEQVAKMALFTKSLRDNKNDSNIQRHLLNKHFYRKHGKNAYYGQDV